MGSIAVAIDLGSLGNTLHVLAFDLGSSGIDFRALECMGEEKVFKTAITIRSLQCLLLSSNKESSNCLSNSPHFDAKGRMRTSLRATFLIAGIDH